MWVIFALLDPDPDPDSEYGSGSGSTDPAESGSNPDPDTDPDPQPCITVLSTVYTDYVILTRLGAIVGRYHMDMKPVETCYLYPNIDVDMIPFGYHSAFMYNI